MVMLRPPRAMRVAVYRQMRLVACPVLYGGYQRPHARFRASKASIIRAGRLAATHHGCASLLVIETRPLHLLELHICAARLRHIASSYMGKPLSKVRAGVLVMSFYIYLAMAFGLGWLIRPILQGDHSSDPQHDNPCRQFLHDPYD
jgi:hypothetical protein